MEHPVCRVIVDQHGQILSPKLLPDFYRVFLNIKYRRFDHFENWNMLMFCLRNRTGPEMLNRTDTGRGFRKDSALLLLQPHM